MQALVGGTASDAEGSAEAAKPMELLLGTAIQPLGRKSMGTVWMHHLGADHVAVKWITLEDDEPHSGGYTAKQKEGMMLREIEATNLLQHPHIVALLGVTRLHTPAAAQRREHGGGHGGSGKMSVGGEDGADRAEPGKATFGIVLELCPHGTLQVRLLQPVAPGLHQLRLHLKDQIAKCCHTSL